MYISTCACLEGEPSPREFLRAQSLEYFKPLIIIRNCRRRRHRQRRVVDVEKQVLFKHFRILSLPQLCTTTCAKLLCPIDYIVYNIRGYRANSKSILGARNARTRAPMILQKNDWRALARTAKYASESYFTNAFYKYYYCALAHTLNRTSVRASIRVYTEPALILPKNIAKRRTARESADFAAQKYIFSSRKPWGGRENIRVLRKYTNAH